MLFVSWLLIYIFLGYELLVSYFVKDVIAVVCLTLRCAEWQLLCLGEDDGEERIKHEVQLCVCCCSSTLV